MWFASSLARSRSSSSSSSGPPYDGSEASQAQRDVFPSLRAKNTDVLGLNSPPRPPPPATRIRAAGIDGGRSAIEDSATPPFSLRSPVSLPPFFFFFVDDEPFTAGTVAGAGEGGGGGRKDEAFPGREAYDQRGNSPSDDDADDDDRAAGRIPSSASYPETHTTR